MTVLSSLPVARYFPYGEKRQILTVEICAPFNSHSNTGFILTLLVFSGSVKVCKLLLFWLLVAFVAEFWLSSNGDWGPVPFGGIGAFPWIEVSMVTSSMRHNFTNILFSLSAPEVMRRFVLG